jgi:predicted Zn finger-like uncharacterized protein
MFLACPACTSRFRVNPQAIGEGRDVRCSKCGNQWFALQSDVHDEQGVRLAPPPAPKPAPVREETEATPAPRPQPIPREYEPNLDMALGDEIPMPFERQFAAEETTPEPEADIDFETLDAALTRSTAALPAAAPANAWRAQKVMIAAACVALVVLNLGTAFLFFRDSIARTIPATRSLYGALGYQDTSGISFADLRLKRTGTEQRPRFSVEGKIVNTLDKPFRQPDVHIALIGKDGEILREVPVEGSDKPLPKDQALPFSVPAKYFATPRAAQAEAMVLRLGSPLELSIADQ